MTRPALWKVGVLAALMTIGWASACGDVDDEDDTLGTDLESGFDDDDDDDASAADFGDNGCGYDYGADPGCDLSTEACRNVVRINRDRFENPEESDCAPRLKWSAELAAVALAHSKDMCDRGFFDHKNPDNQTPFDRMEASGITYVAAGENIAFGTLGAYDADDLEDGFMAEPACQVNHRSNILGRDFTHVGVGIYECSNYVVDGNNYGSVIILTQDFASFSYGDIREDEHDYCPALG
ncbi:MAG: CAP domain-containing protein [Deltaproteobacteria bacterium]|nr:CAP domain-containing protein [Deltaproteobacteria bacterium]